MRSKKKKNIMIIVLCFVLLLMGVGYAALSQRLTIGGTAKMQGVWDVRITNIQLSRKTGLAKDNSHKYENLSASFQTETLAPGDMLEYTVSVSNRGNIDAKVSEINATLDGPEAIKYTVEGIKKGDIIKEGVTKEVIITIKFDENATVIPSNKTSTLNINFTCIQNTQSIPTENLTVYKTRMKNAENSPSETTNFFNGPIARNKIKKITFYDTLNVEGYSNNFDISEDSSGKVLAWYKTDSTGYYELAIGQDGGVIANPNMIFYFAKMPVLEEINLEKLDTFGVTNMANLFYGASSLKKADLSNFDTGNVTNISRMFYNCSSLAELNVSSFVTTKVTDMSNMFYNCNSLTELNINNFDTSNVSNMSRMFYGCYRLTKLDLTNFNTSKVTNMALMFTGCAGLTKLDLTKFDTRNLTNMQSMFSSCTKIKELDIRNFNTSKVTNMLKLFSDCTSLIEIDLTNFNTSNVIDMSNMFFNCRSMEEIDVSGFDTTKVNNMSEMFANLLKINTIYVGSKWTMANVTNSNDMFLNSKVQQVTLKTS
ncbi:MAG: BspA family leucine-rich repeat surface protein [Bacilli bacterium]|nr:BspA family leucine-rich repeat surface protein [Bacilli bacterium]